jgi:hypothetical protein
MALLYFKKFNFCGTHAPGFDTDSSVGVWGRLPKPSSSRWPRNVPAEMISTESRRRFSESLTELSFGLLEANERVTSRAST